MAAGTSYPAAATLLCAGLGDVAALDLVGEPAAAGRSAAARSRPTTAPSSTTSRATPGACSSASSAPRTTTCRPTTCRSFRATWSRTAPRRPTSASTCSPTACAQRFGWIGTRRDDRARRGDAGDPGATAAPSRPLPELVRHAARPQALPPQYVSTVDSGNLCTHLLALAQACLALSREPLATAALRRALAASSTRIALLRAAAARRSAAKRSPTCSAAPSPLERIAAPTRRASRRCSTRAAAELAAGAPAAPRRGDADAGAPARLGGRGPPVDPALGAARRDGGRDEPTPSRRRAARIADDLPRARRRARLHLPLQPQAAPLPHRLSRRRAPARQRLLRPARLGGARDQPVGDRQGRRPRGALGRARPAVLRRRRARRPALVVGVDVRVPDADARPRRAVRQRPAQRRARAPCSSTSRSRASTTCPGASRSRPTPAATTRSPTSTRRRACRAWRCAARPNDELVIAPYATALAAQVVAASRRDQPAPARAGARARPLRLHRGARLLARAPVGRAKASPASAPSWRTTRA